MADGDQHARSLVDQRADALAHIVERARGLNDLHRAYLREVAIRSRCRLVRRRAPRWRSSVSGAVIERTANAETNRMMKVMTASVQSVCVSTRAAGAPERCDLEPQRAVLIQA